MALEMLQYSYLAQQTSVVIWLADDTLLKYPLQSVLSLDIFDSLPKCLPFWAEICLIVTLAPILLSAFQKNQSVFGPTKNLEGRRYGMEGTEETENSPKLRVGPRKQKQAEA